MKLADEMLLAQMRESVLRDVPEEQWNLVVEEVEKADGVRQVQGYTRTLLFDAIKKASFGGDRSEAGRYAANVRWQGQGKRDRGVSEDRSPRFKNYGNDRKGFDTWVSTDPSEAGATLGNLRAWLRAGYVKMEELADRDYDRLNPEPKPSIPPMPPEYNDWGDEPGDDDRARAMLRDNMVPFDTENPLANQITVAPREASPKKTETSSSLDKILPKNISLQDADLSEISSAIRRDLKTQGKKIPFGAEPYLDALDSMGDIAENYGADTGTSVVAYALSNLAQYKGENAKAIKAELKRRLKASR